MEHLRRFGARTMTGPFGMGVLAPVKQSPGPPPTALARVGTPYTALGIPVYGDFDVVTQHIIMTDIANFNTLILNCASINPALLNSTFVIQQGSPAFWGPTSATAFSVGQSNSNNSFDQIYPINAANHSAPSYGTGVASLNNHFVFRHGTRLLGTDFSDTLFRYTTSGFATPVQTGSLASAGGNGCGDPNDADVVFMPRGASIKAVNISGATPTLISTFTPGGSFNAGACQAVGDVLYVVGTGVFQLVDITNPASMSLLGSVSHANFSGVNLCVEPNGKYAYTVNGGASGSHVVHAVDCRTATPVVLVVFPGTSVQNNPMDIFYDSTAGDRLWMITQQPTLQAVSITR